MKTRLKINSALWLVCLAATLGAFNARAFSLLGPFQPWMESTNDLRQPWDIGGPMDFTNEYRWNVPVVTYGFDQSFLDYFGSNGVAAVESAIQILNDLPPASQIVLTNYPFFSGQINYSAWAENLWDLKSETLSLLLEQMGLASPTRYLYVLDGWNPNLFAYQQNGEFWMLFSGTPPNLNEFDPGLFDLGQNLSQFVIGRNFDPQTYDWSPSINSTEYFGTAHSWLTGSNAPYSRGGNYIVVSPVDPFANTSYTAVADFLQGTGEFYSGLTYDDAGGLAYLLSTNNINFETLLPGVSGIGTKADSFVNGAWRPGVDEITFVRVALDPLTGEFFSPLTNQYTDTYITNGNVMHQQLERVTSRPDFLFCAGDVDENASEPSYSLIFRTGTTNWINNAALNGNPSGAGPGVIQPPVRIVFNKFGRQFFTWGSEKDELAFDESMFFGSFDDSTNNPVSYPVPQDLTGPNQTTIRMWLQFGRNTSWSTTRFEWRPTGASGAQFLFQTSTNLTGWTTLFTNSNDGCVTTYFLFNPEASNRFYRLVPQ